MQKVYIPLMQEWETIEDALTYLRAIERDLIVLMSLPDMPTNLYLEVIGDREKGYDIILTNL